MVEVVLIFTAFKPEIPKSYPWKLPENPPPDKFLSMGWELSFFAVSI